MSSNPPDDHDMRYGDDSVRYDNYPITENDVERTDVEWIGFAGGIHGSGAPRLYEPHNETVYEGEIDDENERIELLPESGREVTEESLGEYVEEVGEEHDWEWLSEFAREYLEDDSE